MRTGNLRIDVQYRRGITIAHPVGVLDMATYTSLRDTLLMYAAEQPDGLIVEVEELEMPSRHALSVFALVAIRVADWPGVPLTLVTPLGDQRSALANGKVQVYGTVQAATAGMARPLARSRAVIELPPLPASTREARSFVRCSCERWRVPTLIIDAMTVATALVENTLIHTDSPALLQMELRYRTLTIAASDDDPGLPILHERPEGGVAPSGLLLVAAVAQAWGCMPTMAGGKTVWAVLRLHELPE
ncbi:hypothetical protein JOF56_010313 [Kibdelosporangium banguiense]|uniref:STAS domain-containing protein n=1 Tax=Kibdelosporangium banguiense TaxID=1365924 RepID=A0ABS4TZU7_9PSEU|nr:ATP-binding protein [Kibdelosporangium banguiense]MBP2329928.1 hypothetical protein [Kibdelosporangium banguiense]